MRGSGGSQGLTMSGLMRKSNEISTRKQVGDVESQFAEHERTYAWHGMKKGYDDDY